MAQKTAPPLSSALNPMTAPKRHHYLPEMYLKGFSHDEKKVALYDLETEKGYETSIKNVGVVSELYTIINDKKEKNRSVEQLLSDHIETPAAEAIRKINHQILISDEEKAHLSFFIGFIANRMPSRRESVEELIKGYANAVIQWKFGTLEDTIASMRRRDQDVALEEARELYNFATSSNYEIKPNNAVFIQTLITLGVDLSKKIYSMSWTAYFAPEGTSFITSDNPFMFASEVATLRENEVFNNYPNACCVFPLSRFALLEMRLTEMRTPFGINVITRNSVREFNKACSGLATRLLIGQDLDLIKNIARFAKKNPHRNIGVNLRGLVKGSDSLKKYIDEIKI